MRITIIYTKICMIEIKRIHKSNLRFIDFRVIEK